jgi:hypothetical protein
MSEHQPDSPRQSKGEKKAEYVLESLQSISESDASFFEI